MEVTKARYHVKNEVAKSRSIKGRVAISLAAILLFASGGFVLAALNKPLPQVNYVINDSLTKPTKQVDLAWPSQGQAAIGSLDDGILAVNNTKTKPVPIASITKVITALVVMEKAPFSKGEFGKTYTFTTADQLSFDAYLTRMGTVVPSSAGQKITQYHALQAILLASANNVADSFVRWEFGNTESYLEYANNLIKSYGLKDTKVVDASGFSASSVSTPADLIILGQKILNQPVLAEIVQQKQANLPGIGLIDNSNKLLTKNSAIGIKTGNTDEAGYCLLFATKHKLKTGQSVIIIGAILGMKQSSVVFESSEKLLTSAKKGFGEIISIPEDTEVGVVTNRWGGSSALVTKESLNVYGWKGKNYTPKVEINKLKADMPEESTIGTIKVSDKADGATEIKTVNALAEPKFVWKLNNLL
ncbi:MAG: hypothetical protein M3Q36_01610 [bacterium]|nr:hypothetical protein [bacterium]